MLTLRGEHFCLPENIGVIDQIGPLPTLGSVFSLSRGPSHPLSDALAGRISRGNGICSAGPRGLSPVFFSVRKTHRRQDRRRYVAMMGSWQ